MKKAIKTTLGLMMAGSALFAQSTADAIKALDAEQYQKAKGMLKGLVQAQPAVADNYFWLGQAYLKTGYVDSAKAVFQKGAQADAKSPWNLIGLGAADLENNNAAAAKANFEQALSRASKKDAKPYVYVGRAYAQASKPDYKTAIAYLEQGKAKNDKDAELFLALADAHRDMGDVSSAYGEYRTAGDLDKNMLRAKVEQAVLNRKSGAFQEAADLLNTVVAANASYGPAYRELAETYYRWGNSDRKNYDAKVKQALAYYDKYMDLTDRSLDSRMRHADFLILTQDWKALQQEAQEMAKLDKTNPRIFRYLGYAAYENGNFPASSQALKDFMSKVGATRLIPQDYLYLGQGQLKAGDTVNAMAALKKAIEMDSTVAGVMSEIGRSLFLAKKYDKAAEAYELALKNPQALPVDFYWLGHSHFFDYVTKVKTDPNASKDILVKADSAYSKLLRIAPTTEAGILYKAKIQRYLDKDDEKGLAVPYYEQFVQLVTVTRPEKATTPASNKANLLESYTYLATVAARRDKDNVKALDYINRGLALDPTNAFLNDVKKNISPGK